MPVGIVIKMVAMFANVHYPEISKKSTQKDENSKKEWELMSDIMWTKPRNLNI